MKPTWDKLADENGTKSEAGLYRKALSLLPKMQGFEAFAGVLRGFVALNDKSPMFEDYDGFIETVVEQYRGAYKASKLHGSPSALLALAAGQPPPIAPGRPGRGAPETACGCCAAKICPNTAACTTAVDKAATLSTR